MSAQKRRRERQLARLVRGTRLQVSRLGQLYQVAEDAALAQWVSELQSDVWKHYDDGSSSLVKVQTLVGMVMQDFVVFATYHALADWRGAVTALLEGVGNPPDLVKQYQAVIGGSNEEVADNVSDIEARLATAGIDVVRIRDSFERMQDARLQ